MSLFINTMYPFDHSTRYKSRKWKGKAVTQNVFWKKSVIYLQCRTLFRWKKLWARMAWRTIRKKKPTEETIQKIYIRVKTINLDIQEVPALLRRRVRAERLAMLSRIITKNTRKALEDSGFRHRRKTSPEEPLRTANMVVQVPKKVKKMVEDTRQGRETEYRPVVHLHFEDCLIDRLLPVYTEPSMEVDDVRRSRVLACHQPTCFGHLRAAKRYV